MAAGSLVLFMGVGRPLNLAPPAPGRGMLQASIKWFVDVAEMEDVRFDFDSARISPDGLRALKVNVAQLKRMAPARILVEGHTDEWGSEEYNLRLGEHRARAVRDALIARGWSTSAISSVSYGKARPRCPEHHRVCWAENRRAHLQVSDDRIPLPRPGSSTGVR
jgi:outer membrane protein OmpA-like peptidoglycan-associated protein